MLYLKDDTLNFNFSETVHNEARCRIDFKRTLRIPDDNKIYPLPPSLGRFVLRNTEDYRETIAEKHINRGGVAFPMYQSEAMWINFYKGNYPFAIKIAVGKINALTGDTWTNKLSKTKQDYVVIPDQPWIDGFAIDDGFIRQFVAMKLGDGYTAEEQITGKAEFGGIQIIAYPMKREIYDKLQEEERRREEEARKRAEERRKRKMEEERVLSEKIEKLKKEGKWENSELRQELNENGIMRKERVMHSMNMDEDYSVCASYSIGGIIEESMGMAPGGKMKQEIYRDKYGVEAWDENNCSRVFVSILNSEQWNKATGEKMPTKPILAEDYNRYDMPWFEYYSDNESLEGSDKLAELKSTGNLEIPTLKKKINKIYGDDYKGKKISDGKDKSYIWNE